MPPSILSLTTADCDRETEGCTGGVPVCCGMAADIGHLAVVTTPDEDPLSPWRSERSFHLSRCLKERGQLYRPYRRTQQEVGSDYKSSSHQAGCPKPSAGESAYHRATPQSRSRVESVHVDSLAQNSAGTQKADPGDYLRRNPRGVSLTNHRREPHETARCATSARASRSQDRRRVSPTPCR